MTREEATVGESDDGQRLDRWIKKHYPGISFGMMQKILRTGQLRIDGKRAGPDTRLVAGQKVRIPPQLVAPREEKRGISEKDADFIRSLVLYQDENVIAINKPAGIATQGGTKVGRHIDGLLEGLAADGEKPHLVHRLDKDTSGVLLLARHVRAARALGDMFQGRDIRKYYWAVTVPAPAMAQGKIKSALAKVDAGGGERMIAVSDTEGKMALTYYSVVDSIGDQLAWVAFWPRTGRTHQIRVHAAEMGCPLLGDYKYGPDQSFLEEKKELPKTLHLHARRIIMPYPYKNGVLDITAPLSPEMKKTFKYFGFAAEDKSDPFSDLD